jgi:uncharacterized Zn finger protein
MKVITDYNCKCCSTNEPVLVRDGKKYQVKCLKCGYTTASRPNRKLAVMEWERDNEKGYVIL